MSFINVLQECQRVGIKLLVQDGRLMADDPGGNLTAELKGQLGQHKPEIIAWLSGDSGTSDNIPVQPERDDYPLSFAQQQLWLIDQVQGASPEYNFPTAYELNGELSLPAMQNALNNLVERHNVLRTVFQLKDEKPVQRIMPAEGVEIHQIDLTDTSASEQPDIVNKLIEEESGKAFDLSRDLMLRCTLIRLAETRHVVLFTMHHIACDGWSLSLLVKEFVTAYESYLKDQSNPLPPLPVQYSDFAAWQRESMQGGVLNKDLAYWQKQLADIPVVHSLPLDFPRPANQKFNAKRHVKQVNQTLLEGLQRLGSQHQASLFMVLQSAFALILGRFSGESDIVIGVPNGGRARN